MIVVAVNTEGRREALGQQTMPSEAQPFWTQPLRSLMRYGVHSVEGVDLRLPRGAEPLETATQDGAVV